MRKSVLKIVGIGASAGGVEAFRLFFEKMPANSGFAFVVILHLAPDRKSLLPEILARWTKMPVLAAADDLLVQADHVYVVPPGTAATLTQGRLRLRQLTTAERHQASTIDVFFDSLAADLKERAIGIILSGTGHDGALGMKAIREVGGVTIAQGSDGTVPLYAGMPDSAIATGAVDRVIPVEEIPELLVASQTVAEMLYLSPAISEDAIEQHRRDICRVLQERIGHDFSRYKDKTFMRRVNRRMQVLNLTDYAAYVARLEGDRDENVLLFRDLLIGVTSFFRDAETFALLARDYIPGLFKGKSAINAVRVWVAACATGEEAYSLAILLHEYADTLDTAPQIMVFASDLDELAIATARVGRYPATLLQDMSPERLARFFVKTESGYVVTKEIRDICTFSPHSLIRDPPFSRVDFVSCRNLLIYMDNELQAQVIPTFHYALVPGGILLLGSAETVSRFETLFSVCDKKHRIFQRNDVPSQLPQLPLRTISMSGPDKTSGNLTPAREESWVQSVNRAKNRMLEMYTSAFVVVSITGEVLHYSNRTGRFFEPAPGPPSTNLFDMARSNVRLSLRSVLRRASESGQRVEQRLFEGVDTPAREVVTLLVEPMSNPGPNQLFLIVFAEAIRTIEAEVSAGGLSAAQLQASGAAERENRDLREQFQSIKEEHETALEELRSSNEELHSVNEELQSSNEELETSREEIQSINEEMSTVNTQLSQKVEQLDRANSDLKNLFDSTRVATIFLDKHFIIRAFTPEVAGIYKLIPTDIGRSLMDIVNRLDYADLRTDVRKVLQTLEPLERRVARADGRAHYLMRILPYRSPDSSVDGSLITFMEVTSIVQAEQHQRLLVDELNHRVKNMLTVVISLATQTLRRAPSMEAFSDVFIGRVHALTKAYELLSGRSWREVLLADVLAEELRPFMSDTRDNIRLQGPEVSLDARGALAVGMAIHELSTNAVKYGSLSVADGDVSVDWRVEPGDDGPYFVLDWIERNGPPVALPQKRGFGMVLIERGFSHDLAGEAHIEFVTAGVHARLRAPLRRITLETENTQGET